MKKNKYLFLVSLVLTLGTVLTSCDKDDDNNDNKPEVLTEEIVAVSNRASSSLSFIDLADNSIENMIIPNSEPMYVIYIEALDKIYLGDRKQNQVHVINPQTRQIETSIGVGKGVFHMWADEMAKQLWVVNSTDKTLSVIDLANNSVIKTIEVDYTPHDVFVSYSTKTAYVSLLTGDGPSDYVYSYDISSFNKKGEVTVGKSPHLFHSPMNNTLYVAHRAGLTAVNEDNLSVMSEKDIPGAHGIFLDPKAERLFIAGFSASTIQSVTADSKMDILSSIATPEKTPHNLILNDAGNMLFISHFGNEADKVTIYTVGSNGELSHKTTLTTQNDPNGIDYYKREMK